jgi:hypothetical protein
MKLIAKVFKELGFVVTKDANTQTPTCAKCPNTNKSFP